MSSIDTFWLADALEARRAIAERHSTEVECLKKPLLYSDNADIPNDSSK